MARASGSGSAAAGSGQLGGARRFVARRRGAILRAQARGGMAEWLKAHAWKACIRETVSWVRIPLPPPPPAPQQTESSLRVKRAAGCPAVHMFPSKEIAADCTPPGLWRQRTFCDGCHIASRALPLRLIKVHRGNRDISPGIPLEDAHEADGAQTAVREDATRNGHRTAMMETAVGAGTVLLSS